VELEQCEHRDTPNTKIFFESVLIPYICKRKGPKNRNFRRSGYVPDSKSSAGAAPGALTENISEQFQHFQTLQHLEEANAAPSLSSPVSGSDLDLPSTVDFLNTASSAPQLRWRSGPAPGSYRKREKRRLRSGSMDSAQGSREHRERRDGGNYQGPTLPLISLERAVEQDKKGDGRKDDQELKEDREEESDIEKEEQDL
jgi:hypothetical protein